MNNDMIGEFEECQTSQEMWKLLEMKYGGTSTTRLRGLTIRFDSYFKDTMKQHLPVMSIMICELKVAGNNLIDEQTWSIQFLGLGKLWQLLDPQWDIKTSDDMARHLELEAERLEAVKPNNSAHMV